MGAAVGAVTAGGSSTITVRRALGSASIGARLSVLVDGLAVGRLRPTKTLVVPVHPGSHTVTVTLGYFTSPVLTVEVGDHEDVQVQCKSSISAMALRIAASTQIYTIRETGRSSTGA